MPGFHFLCCNVLCAGPLAALNVIRGPAPIAVAQFMQRQDTSAAATLWMHEVTLHPPAWQRR